MNKELSGNQLTGGMVGLIVAGLIIYPLVSGQIEMWSIYAIIIGVLLIIVSAVVFFSDSTPQEDHFYNRGGGV
ncbi:MULTISPECIES: hypothetical protein [Haloferacaceae]|uniref:Uncharacterized protein n=1 Tax=Halorubrum glutamatedens TaxID=2707018 RepID=A0ABD5QRF3_9EURY|nr:hypothetical protein [Halobellus captivus]